MIEVILMSQTQPIRVAQIIGKWVGGGVEAVVMNYYRHIDHSKVQFDFICDEDSTNIPYDEIKSLGGKVILIPPYQKVFKYHHTLKKILKQGNYPIVHSHINTLSVFSLWAARSANIPVRIAHSHSTTNPKEKKKNLLKQLLRPFSKLFATNYMCCSELAGRWLFGNNIYEEGRVKLLNNAIDVENFVYDKEIRLEVRKELNIKDNMLVVGHIGRFVEQKNHQFLIDIFNEVHRENKNSILLLVGQGPLEESIKEKVEALGLKDSVIFLGQRNDTNRLYQAMDVFVLPSLYEGLPVVGVEAQTAGLPCILSSDMTKETKVLDSTNFIDLNKRKSYWKNNIFEATLKYPRKNTIKEITDKGFNIESEAHNLEDYYLSNMKKNIIHVVNSKIYSGLENVACNIINNIDDYNMIYVTQDGPIVNMLKQKNVKYELIEKMSIKEIRRVIRKYRPSLIHAHDYTASVVCANATNKINVISHIHHDANWTKYLNARTILYFLSSINIKKILIVSNGIKEKYIFGKLLDKKYECIENPISYQSIINKITGTEETNYDICCMGRLTEAKNPFLFIDIVKKLKIKKQDIKALWIGTGELSIKFKKAIKINNLNENIKLLGFKENPYPYLKTAKIFVLPSKWEGFGLSAYEALALGLPSVVSNVGGLKKIVNKGCGMLCDNINDFTNEIELLLNNNTYYQNKVKNAKEHAMALDNSEKYYHNLLTIYREYTK